MTNSLPKYIRYLPGTIIELNERVMRAFLPVKVTVIERTDLGHISLTLKFEYGGHEPRTKIMSVPQFRNYLEEQEFVSLSYPEKDDVLVTVCSVCRRASCWQGYTDCRDEGKKPVQETKRKLRGLALESEEYWD